MWKIQSKTERVHYYWVTLFIFSKNFKFLIFKFTSCFFKSSNFLGLIFSIFLIHLSEKKERTNSSLLDSFFKRNFSFLENFLTYFFRCFQYNRFVFPEYRMKGLGKAIELDRAQKSIKYEKIRIFIENLNF